ncbi:hypothetical protein JAAARDRAFT_298959 [Jaapia argillacea MUCL 33604]|uniref:Uncharacterized protein n=1 Tax=Jaapia argillacea MUCL 33604 TaxID=933084 RepID=A0A067Q263_9AGAM|nr:hypothetical protein JAAARDRAFT_298959 [Jaapia argillacea MUCL 33604]
MSNTTGEAVYSYPPLPACWNITNQPCPATMDMLTFFNISSQNSYYQYYCLNPPQDSCEFGYCPNADVAGLYVRVSTYVTNVCLALLILYSPDEVATTFYAQILSVYSLVITTFISIADHSLTRLHGTYALITAGSPLSITLAIYALRSLFQKDTRMHAVYGKGRERWWINRILVLLMIPCWIGILVYLSIATKHGSLSQVACDSEGLAQDLLIFMFIIPVVPFVFSVEWGLIGLIPWFILIVTEYSLSGGYVTGSSPSRSAQTFRSTMVSIPKPLLARFWRSQLLSRHLYRSCTCSPDCLGGSGILLGFAF